MSSWEPRKHFNFGPLIGIGVVLVIVVAVVAGCLPFWSSLANMGNPGLGGQDPDSQPAYTRVCQDGDVARIQPSPPPPQAAEDETPPKPPEFDFNKGVITIDSKCIRPGHEIWLFYKVTDPKFTLVVPGPIIKAGSSVRDHQVIKFRPVSQASAQQQPRYVFVDVSPAAKQAYEALARQGAGSAFMPRLPDESITAEYYHMDY